MAARADQPASVSPLQQKRTHGLTQIPKGAFSEGSRTGTPAGGSDPPGPHHRSRSPLQPTGSSDLDILSRQVDLLFCTCMCVCSIFKEKINANVFITHSTFTDPWCDPSGMILGIIWGQPASCRCMSFCEGHCQRSAHRGRILKLGGSDGLTLMFMPSLLCGV